MTTEKIYKVIRILSENSLAINAGRRDGFNENDEVEVYIQGEALTDPDSGEALGHLYYIKDTLKITYSDSNYSICQRVVVETLRQASPIQKMMGVQPAVTKTYIEKLNVFNDQITGYGIPEENLTKSIVVGDLIRKKEPF